MGAGGGPPAPQGFVGAVLCGGRSTRMGRDKSLLEIDGSPMAARVAEAMRLAGAEHVFAVGGDRRALTALGLDHVPDAVADTGPLGGIASALARSRAVTLVVGCDLVHPSPAAMRATVDALRAAGEVDVVVPLVGGRPQWVHAAWRPSALPAIEAALRQGIRAVHRAALDLQVRHVTGIPADALADADTPTDLPPGERSGPPEERAGPGTVVG